MCPPAVGLQPKKPLCSSCFWTRSFSGRPHSFHANIIYFCKGLINIKMCTSVTEQEHLHRALLQKWPFHFTLTLEPEMTFKREKPSSDLNYRPIHKTILFCRLCIIFALHLKPHWSCALVWVKVSQDTENEWRKWWVTVLVFKMVPSCSELGHNYSPLSGFPSLASQGKWPVSQSVPSLFFTVSSALQGAQALLFCEGEGSCPPERE